MEICSECGTGLRSLKSDATTGDSPIFGLKSASYERFSESRTAWECSLNGS
jgi:hypothetical protein